MYSKPVSWHICCESVYKYHNVCLVVEEVRYDIIIITLHICTVHFAIGFSCSKLRSLALCLLPENSSSILKKLFHLLSPVNPSDITVNFTIDHYLE